MEQRDKIILQKIVASVWETLNEDIPALCDACRAMLIPV